MWVNSNPFQCGEFICYNLDSVFSKAKYIKTNKSINEKQLTIPEDPFLHTNGYHNFIRFKQIKHYLIFITKKSPLNTLSLELEKAFIQSNPESYYMYQLLGDYYCSRSINTKAVEYYNLALTKEIATVKEEKQIKECLKKLSN